MNTVIGKVLVNAPDHYPGMAQDASAERRTEIPFIDGAIVPYAEAKGIEVTLT